MRRRVPLDLSQKEMRDDTGIRIGHRDTTEGAFGQKVLPRREYFNEKNSRGKRKGDRKCFPLAIAGTQIARRDFRKSSTGPLIVSKGNREEEIKRESAQKRRLPSQRRGCLIQRENQEDRRSDRRKDGSPTADSGAELGLSKEELR